MFQNLIRTSDDTAALIARVTAGLVMFPHGAQKMLGWFGGGGFSGTTAFFSGQLGIPAFLTALIIIGEFFGSLGLITGFLGRFCAAATIVIMLGAVFMVHLGNGFFMNWYGNQQGEGYEYHLLMIGLCLIVLLRGSGKMSIDRRLMK